MMPPEGFILFGARATDKDAPTVLLRSVQFYVSGREGRGG
jgi:hypothetical protein